jgi:DNA-binding response OmpR family regulator
MGGIVRLLIAHGEPASRAALERVAAGLADAGLKVVGSGEGRETVHLLLATDAPDVALIDWDLPGCDGPEVCRLVRARRRAGLPYIILLARGDHPIAVGLDAGANDCVQTPAKADELLARISVGRRFSALPWHRVAGAGAGDALRSPEGALAALTMPSLDAQRSRDDDFDWCGEPSVGTGARFQLKSVLATE